MNISNNDSCLYPGRIVAPSLMKDVSMITDIRDDIQYAFLDEFPQISISQYYDTPEGRVLLGFARSTFSHDSGRLNAFYTANLCGLDSLQKFDSIFSRTHILQDPIKYLGKDLFGQVLDIFQNHHISCMNLSPFDITGSRGFYDKMACVYADRIADVLVAPDDDLVFLLKPLSR